MKETDKQIAEILKKGLEIAEKSGNFIIEQAPDVIQQLITWKIAQNIVIILMCSICFYLFSKWYKNLKKEIKNFDILDDAPHYLTIVIISNFFLIPLVFISILNLTKLIFVPKIYLIEYASNLIR